MINILLRDCYNILLVTLDLVSMKRCSFVSQDKLRDAEQREACRESCIYARYHFE